MDKTTQKTFSVEKLKESEEYKKWIGKQKVVKIHDTYYDSGDDYATYIVITKKEWKVIDDSYTITRFFRMGLNPDKIHVSVDQQDISAEAVFTTLLEKYSSGLK